jgi:hypothetical protein
MKYLQLLIFIFFGINSSAQKIIATLEDRSKYLLHSLKLNSREKHGFQDGSNIIQVEKTGIKFQTGYTVRFDGTKHGLIIRKINTNGKEIAVNRPEGGEKVFGPIATEPVEFDGKILLFYYKYIDQDSMKLYVSEVDRNSLELTNTMHLFSYQQENVGIFKLMRAANREINLRISEDQSKLLVVVTGNKEDIFSCVFDKNRTILRKRKSILTGTKNLIISQICVDNNGNNVIAFSQETYTSNTRSSSEIYTSNTFDKTISRKFLIQNLNNTDKLVDVEAWGMGFSLQNARFQASRDQTKIYVYGDYTGVVGSAGIWLSEIQAANLNATKPKTIPYPDDFKRKIYDIGFGERKRSDYGILSADFQLSEFENGDLAISGSPMLYEGRDRAVVNGETYSYGKSNFFSGPIMIAILKNKSETVFTMIPRYQHHSYASKSLFIPYMDKLVVLYNDKEKNITGSGDPEDVRMKGVIRVSELSLAAAIVNKEGKVESRKILVEAISKSNFYNLWASEFLSEKKLIVPPVSGDKKDADVKFAVISIE